MFGLFSTILAKQPPVVLMHGIQSDAQSMEFMASLIREQYPGIYTKSCEVGNGGESSIFMAFQRQIDELTLCINNDPNLADGFIGVGFSQGGILLRGYLEQHNHNKAPMKRLITLSSPVGGFFCGRNSTCNSYYFPDFLNNLMADLVYTDLVQNLVGAAGYWRDPYNLENYEEGCSLLPDLDNIRNYDEQRRLNYLSIDKHIAYGSEIDSVIQPWQSAWFSVWADDDDSTVVPMEDRPEYKQDLFGLKTMREQGRIITLNSHLIHFDYPGDEAWIRANLLQWIEMDVLDTIQIDTQRPLLDLSHTGIATLEVDAVLARTLALILTGNKIVNFYFLRYLPNLQLLCCDFCSLPSMAGIQDEVTPHLKHFILRGNNIETFQYLGKFATLETLDLSQNRLQMGTESAVKEYPCLKTLRFGLAETRRNPHKLSCSNAAINAASLFMKVFLARFDTICLEEQRKAQLGQYVVQASLTDQHVEFKAECRRAGVPATLKAFSIVPGFQVALISTMQFELSQIDQLVVSLEEIHAGVQLPAYPTDASLLAQETEQLDLLKSRMTDQLRADGKNFIAICIQLELEIAVFTFRADKDKPRFVEFLKLQEAIQSDIQLAEESRMRMENAPKIVQLSEIAPEQNKPFWVEPRELVRARYYYSKATEQELARQAQEKIFSQTLKKYQIPRLREAVRIAARLFNQQNGTMAALPGKTQITLFLNVDGISYPLVVDLNSLPAEPNGAVIPRSLQQAKFIVAAFTYQKLDRVLVAEYPVLYRPIVARVEIQQHPNIIEAVCFENIDGAFVQIGPGADMALSYTFFRNREVVKEGQEPVVKLDFQGLPQDGYWEVSVHQNTKTVKSDGIYVAFEE